MPPTFSKLPAVTFRVSLACELQEVRPATLAVRTFLAEQGLNEDELIACELALVEACNNAVQYATEGGKAQPIDIQVVCHGSGVEMRVQDHTPGFDCPIKAELPHPESTRGRGIYVIQTLMDHVSYLRGVNENALCMSKARIQQEHRQTLMPPTTLEEANRRLEENKEVIRDMAKELCVRSERLSAIFRCSAELGKTNNLEDFAHRVLNDLLHIVAAERFLLRLVPKKESRLVPFACSILDHKTDPLIFSGSPEIGDSAEIQAAISRKEIWWDHHHPLSASDPLQSFCKDCFGVVRPICLGDTLVGTLVVGKNAAQQPFTAAQTTVIQTFTDLLAIQIVNARLQEEQLNSLMVARELEVARNIQRALLPKTLPQIRGFGLAGYCESARQVGGDFYDVIQLTDRSLLLIVADVMGKGVPAAMFAAILRRLVRGMPKWATQPSELLSRVNRLMIEELSEVDMFITAQLVYVDAEKRELTAASAGHCPALIVTNGQDQVQTISPEGMPLGILPTTTFKDEFVKLGDRCRVLLHTDGLPEARNAHGELFGQERVSQWLKQSLQRDQTAEQLKEDFAKELDKFQCHTSLSDDQTFLILADEVAAHASNGSLS
jgi:serine phosphatase RsbU (regulator of sigma subunit)/anti-sigma regulatory factor (Ser/Thr protein kinase)